MIAVGKVDLVQDMTTDCSVVASLCAGTARAERGHARVGLLALNTSPGLTVALDHLFHNTPLRP